MNVLGIDASTKCTGIALINSSSELLFHSTIDLHNIKDIDKRTDEMMLQIASFFNAWKPDICFIEDTWGGGSFRNVETTKKLTAIQGAVRYICLENNCEFNKVIPSAWRSVVGISGGKNTKREEFKQRALDWVKNKYDIEVGEDEAESICISYAGTILKTEEI